MKNPAEIRLALTDDNKHITGIYQVRDLYRMIARDEHTNYALADYLTRAFHKHGVPEDVLTVTIISAIGARYDYRPAGFFGKVYERILDDDTAPVSMSILEAIVRKAFEDETVGED